MFLGKKIAPLHFRGLESERYCTDDQRIFSAIPFFHETQCAGITKELFDQ